MFNKLRLAVIAALHWVMAVEITGEDDARCLLTFVDVAEGGKILIESQPLLRAKIQMIIDPDSSENLSQPHHSFAEWLRYFVSSHL
jgi:hypothetical protein